MSFIMTVLSKRLALLALFQITSIFAHNITYDPQQVPLNIKINTSKDVNNLLNISEEKCDLSNEVSLSFDKILSFKKNLRDVNKYVQEQWHFPQNIVTTELLTLARIFRNTFSDIIKTALCVIECAHKNATYTKKVKACLNYLTNYWKVYVMVQDFSTATPFITCLLLSNFIKNLKQALVPEGNSSSESWKELSRDVDAITTMKQKPTHLEKNFMTIIPMYSMKIFLDPLIAEARHSKNREANNYLCSLSNKLINNEEDIDGLLCSIKSIAKQIFFQEAVFDKGQPVETNS